MQQASGELPPIAFLEGDECKLVSTAPIAGSTVYDVYEGLWLGEEKVAVKVLRSSKASENNVKVGTLYSVLEVVLMRAGGVEVP